MYRMPVHFGPAPGPRNLPADRQATRYAHQRYALSVTARSDADALCALLPPRCTLAGEPLVTVTVSRLTELAWLAGRGYNIVQIQIPDVRFEGTDGPVTGAFVPVVWENLADPIITGREELGMAKIWAEIPDPQENDGRISCAASWLGFAFLELTAEAFADAPPPAGASPPVLCWKYMPHTGDWGRPDVEYMTATGSDPNAPELCTEVFRRGTGRFRFNPARWEDMPTQYPIVNALAELPLHGFTGAALRMTSQGETDTRGGGNFCGQEEVA
jgi:hypothetical protein